jgi:predicted DNA-binding transcriptional regulator YafY
LGKAIAGGLPVEVVYAGGSKGAVPRKITPKAVLRHRGYAYLAAYCHLDGKEKMYRLDRIGGFRVLE